MKDLKLKLFNGGEELCCVGLVETYNGDFNDKLLKAMLDRVYGFLKARIEIEKLDFNI